jgi:hypothetical protein
MKAIKQQQEQCTHHGEYTAVLWKHDATYGFTNELRQLADYPWYVRIWARLTYKI